MIKQFWGIVNSFTVQTYCDKIKERYKYIFSIFWTEGKGIWQKQQKL